jgi:hypothetical protein
MSLFTLHNSNGDFMHDSTRGLNIAKTKCDNVNYKCVVYITYIAPSPWDPTKKTEHLKEVYRNF